MTYIKIFSDIETTDARNTHTYNFKVYFKSSLTFLVCQIEIVLGECNIENILLI